MFGELQTLGGQSAKSETLSSGDCPLIEVQLRSEGRLLDVPAVLGPYAESGHLLGRENAQIAMQRHVSERAFFPLFFGEGNGLCIAIRAFSRFQRGKFRFSSKCPLCIRPLVTLVRMPDRLLWKNS